MIIRKIHKPHERFVAQSKCGLKANIPLHTALSLALGMDFCQLCWRGVSREEREAWVFVFKASYPALFRNEVKRS